MSTKTTTAPSATTCSPAKVVAMVEAIDTAYALILQLHALLINTYGESGDPFRNLADDLQDRYLWACTDMARKIETTLEASFEVATS